MRLQGEANSRSFTRSGRARLDGTGTSPGRDRVRIGSSGGGVSPAKVRL